MIVKGKPDDVENAVKEAVANGVNAIWPGCDIFPTAPQENMKALMAATQKYGKLSWEILLYADPTGVTITHP